MKKITTLFLFLLLLALPIFGDYTYNFSRELVNGMYNINNIERVDVSGNQILLATEIESALPGKSFKIICDGANADIIFVDEISGPEQTTLNIVVTAHKNNS